MAAKKFEYLFVESSGWGDPSNMMEILEAAKVVSGYEYDLRGVICFVDAVNFLEQVKDEESAHRQLKHCSLAVMTKTDLADPKQTEQVREKIREINPDCRILTSVKGELGKSLLEQELKAGLWAEPEETTNSIETKPKSIFMEYEGEVEKDRMNQFLKEISSDVHRVKGFCRLKETGWTQIDVVGSLIDYKKAEEEKETLSQLVFISKIGPAVIKKIFAAWEARVGTEMKLRN